MGQLDTSDGGGVMTGRMAKSAVLQTDRTQFIPMPSRPISEAASTAPGRGHRQAATPVRRDGRFPMVTVAFSSKHLAAGLPLPCGRPRRATSAGNGRYG